MELIIAGLISIFSCLLCLYGVAIAKGKGLQAILLLGAIFLLMVGLELFLR